MSDQGGSSQVYAIADGSTSVDFCTASVSITLLEVDQRGYLRGGVTDAGAFELEGVLSTRNILAAQFKVYPNPTSSILNIEGVDQIVKEIKIVNMQGVMQMRSNSTQIDVSNLARGVYLVHITTNDNAKTTKRFIVK